MSDIRVLLADDEPRITEAFRLLLGVADGYECVGAVADGEAAVEACEELQPDVVLMDLQMPRLNGIEATRRIVAGTSGTRVLAVTTFSTENHVIPALQAGASGYLLKDASPEAILGAVTAASNGESALSSSVVAQLIMAAGQRAEGQRLSGSGDTRPGARLGDQGKAVPEAAAPELTARERDVLTLLAKGMSNAEIAARLYLAEATVKTNLGKITAKLGVRDRVQALIRAAELGIVRLELDR